MPNLKVAVLADGQHVPRFGLMALDALDGCDELTVFSCGNTRVPRHPFKHGAYFALNLLTIRNRLTAAVPIAEGKKRVARVLSFESGYEGIWQTLPPAIVEELAQFDVVVKLGMYLLRVPEGLQTPILSFHHGDPDHYRGRPAGFWEMVHKSPVMGQIIQVISNRLDAGRVVAYGETRVVQHSYRTTLMTAMCHSPLLINQAVRNALSGVSIPKHSNGKNYRLPSNARVIGFCLVMAWSFLKRLFYGAFVEKKWNVSTASGAAAAPEGLVTGRAFPLAEQWRTFPIRPPYIFYADPFFAPGGEGVLVEALNRRTGLGEIILLDGERQELLFTAQGHLSYPFTFEVSGSHYLLPEAASWDTPRIYALNGEGVKPAGQLRVANGARVVDPTLLEHDGRFYLFGNDSRIGPNVLFIWSGPSLDGVFEQHPACPALVSPRGARMGGGFVQADGRLVRLGQSYVGEYGDGLFAFEVEELSPDVYREREVGQIKFQHVHGPHTLNWRGDHIAFDWYRERWSLLVATRRLMAKRRAKLLQNGMARPPVLNADS